MSITPEEWEARAKSFGAEAANYAYGRPSYPADAVTWALGEPSDPASLTVLDLAAGTGKLTETLLALGCRVIAVEPLEEMRALIPPAATALSGTAEQIPADDASVDAVVVGQAWHWFDTAAATAEVVRVLKPGGRVGALWNMYDGDDPTSLAMATAVAALSSHDASLDGTPPWPAGAGIVESARRSFRHSSAYDTDRLVAYAMSHSWVINSDDVTRAGIVANVRSLAADGPIEIVEKVTVWRGHT